MAIENFWKKVAKMFELVKETCSSEKLFPFWFTSNMKKRKKWKQIIRIRFIFNQMARISQTCPRRRKSSQLLFVWDFPPVLKNTARNILALLWSVIDFNTFHPGTLYFGADFCRASRRVQDRTCGWCCFLLITLSDRQRWIVLKKVAGLLAAGRKRSFAG